MSKLTIEQWFARAVAAVLVPDWDNIWAYNHCDLKIVGFTSYEGNGEEYNGQTMSIYGDFAYFDRVQLRKNGVDRVELWTTEDIPTEKNIGEMCWLLHDGNISLTKLTDLWNEMECNNEVMYHSTNIDSCLNSDEYKILLATNGNIAPKPKDFEKVYGEI